MMNYYLCDKEKKLVVSYGPLPASWRTISGMTDLSYEAVSDLSWARYPEMGFLTEKDALAQGISPGQIATCKLSVEDNQWGEIRNQRDLMIQAVRWRIDRHNDEIQLKKIPSENIMPVLDYIQKLRDVTEQLDPYNIQWPSP